MDRIERDEYYSFSENVRSFKLDDDNYILWNRFFPNLLKLNEEAYLAVKELGNKKFNRGCVGRLNNFIDVLLKYKLLYKGDTDPYQKEFFKCLDRMVEKSNRKAREFYAKKQEYAQLYILNTVCNLQCPYCARKHNPNKLIQNIAREEKMKLLYSVVDQFVERKVKNGVNLITISFNGGEFLLEWGLIKSLVQRNEKKYSGLTFKYFINTNMTVMNEEISMFFSHHDFNIDMSIDGYPEAHNISRKYHNGKGSFVDVKKNLEIYNKYNKDKPITSFQGTVGNVDAFLPEKVYEMKRFGFKEARLGPNLLNVSEEETRKKVEIFGRFLELNQQSDFFVSDSFFDNIKRLIQLEDYSFYFSCNGLGCLPRMGLHLDITAMTFSHICDYCPSAAVPVEELDYDIYNPKLWEVSYGFIKERAESLKRNCSQCDLVGICKGDCIMLGLDNENKKNENACLFQNEIWGVFLNYLYKEQNESHSIEKDKD